ncbi:MAG: hypothetical protein ACRD0P_07575, partial [Stackebrandtia sp.]
HDPRPYPRDFCCRHSISSAPIWLETVSGKHAMAWAEPAWRSALAAQSVANVKIDAERSFPGVAERARQWFTRQSSSTI